MKHILHFIFGKKAEGEILSQPTFKTINPKHRLSEADWIKEVKFGSRYGYRGSFYEEKFRYTVA